MMDFPIFLGAENILELGIQQVLNPELKTVVILRHFFITIPELKSCYKM